MTMHAKALRALAQAYDREDSAQRGEPDPWGLDDPGDIGDSDTWVSERLACARVAADAYISALLLEDAAGLVERLRGPLAISGEHRDEAASLIQSQAARIAELEAGLETIAVFPNPPTVSQARARALLNGERKEEPQPTSRALRRDDWHYDSDGYCDNPGRGY